MSIRVSLQHNTYYEFDRETTLFPHIVRLRPAIHSRTPILSYSLNIEPSDHFINWQQDAFGNFLARLIFNKPAKKLSVEVDLVADMTVINPFDFFIIEEAEIFPFDYNEQTKKELTPYLEWTENGKHLQDWLSGIKRKRMKTLDFIVEINQKLQKDIGYTIRLEPGIQTCEETLKKRTGSCRDSAWLLVQIMRHFGLAARFASGYIVQLKADEKSLDGPSGTEVDFTDLHAWTEVFVPGAGWIGLDPTSGLLTSEGHIPLSCTPHPVSAAPITGATSVCKSTLHFENIVQRIHEDPRVTKPYSDDEWVKINNMGHRIDEIIDQEDIRLTLGGEPTFVSIDNMDTPEWNTAALGKEKHEKAVELLRRLKGHYAPKGLLHFGQGKWYPGEELPRWAYSCIWRKDGKPVWENPDLTADIRKQENHTAEDAKTFLETLCANLELQTRCISTGYEDVYYYLWKEGTLPVNVDPFKTNLKDSMERKRLRKLLEEGLDRVTGYAIPLRWNYDLPKPKWESSVWDFKRGRMYLLPGDSPMGYRLPLDSIPMVSKKDLPLTLEASYDAPKPQIKDFVREFQEKVDQKSKFELQRKLHSLRPVDTTGQPGYEQQSFGQSLPSDADDYMEFVRTAMCVEPRNGNLCIFMPPTLTLEPYLHLIAAIEHTAKQLNMRVIIEGYSPPSDPRITTLKVTPDPGVIEVNMHPADSWEEMVETTTTLYEEARQSRLGTEKFMLDGKHTGTGGGNHVTIGAAEPADSPFLRRPDLLRSIVNYWQHHPSLSYLFSGAFIGPTSQAPRTDEARDDNMYELEIAFQQVDSDIPQQPWIVDRIFRNLLVDITGNTHRTEISIDKLYSPDSFSGRQGLVEFRCFEMPPHSRMSLVQMLLLRGLICWFWKEPYKNNLVRWGTEIHDRFMLPHYVQRDFGEIIRDLNRAGFPFEEHWFSSFFEFRFPRYGTLQIDDLQLELRMALEPWNVLGEEVSSSGTARYVDSSIERLQVKVTGMTDPRYVVSCNGRRVPLHNTGTQGEFVSGVRYRAWQPPSCLHPTIPVHAPLTFDLHDLWAKRSIGGCRYHVFHPGGRGYDTFPVNAYEAESRRMGLFRELGHTHGRTEVPPEEKNSDFPYTLDLRKRATI